VGGLLRPPLSFNDEVPPVTAPTPADNLTDDRLPPAPTLGADTLELTLLTWPATTLPIALGGGAFVIAAGDRSDL